MRLEIDFKHFRAAYIASHLLNVNNGLTSVVVFTCGNAAAALRATWLGSHVMEIGPGPNALLRPARWLTPNEIAAAFPDHFDATSGHLPFWLMLFMAQELRRQFIELRNEAELFVPSGSGESAVLCALAFPECKIWACFDNSSPATEFNPKNPLYSSFGALRIQTQVN